MEDLIGIAKDGQFWGPIGMALLVIYTIITDKLEKRELKKEKQIEVTKKELAQKELSDMSISNIDMMRDMESTVQKVHEDNIQVQSALQVILSKI